MIKEEIVQQVRDYYKSYRHPAGNGFDILDLSDDLLGWLISVLRRDYLSAPTLSEKEWNIFLSVLRNHWIEPLLAYSLHSAPDQTLPPKSVQEHLLRSFRSAHVSSLQVETQIRRIVRTAEFTKTDLLIGKGPALGCMVYPHPALRTGSDLDLYVPPGQVRKFSDALISEGYDIRYNSFSISPNLYHHLNLYPEASMSDSRMIEIHWRPLFLPGSAGKITIEDLITDAIIINTGIVEFRTLSPVDALLYAASHMCIFHASMLRLSWITDIHLLAGTITKEKLWQNVMDKCTSWQSRLSLEHALKHAEIWYGTQLPAPYDHWNYWPDPDSKELVTFSHLKNRQDGEEIHLHEILVNLPTIREKILAIWLFITRTDTIRMNYPGTRWFEYPSIWWVIISKELKK